MGNLQSACAPITVCHHWPFIDDWHKNKSAVHRRQTSIKEFILSLFPFLFIFWMLGGFDMVRNRKQGGVGGMFGNNYSEWDEEDWEDEDDEMDPNDTTDTNINFNESQQKQKGEDAQKKSTEDEEMDKRTAFFRKLGIDLNTNKEDETKQNNGNQQQISVNSNGKKERKKRKRVRFKNVCGNEEAKLDLQDLVDYLKNPQKYQKMGCKLPKGVLMAGPPGTG